MCFSGDESELLKDFIECSGGWLENWVGVRVCDIVELEVGLEI